jgi:hypothetical protein
MAKVSMSFNAFPKICKFYQVCHFENFWDCFRRYK